MLSFRALIFMKKVSANIYPDAWDCRESNPDILTGRQYPAIEPGSIDREAIILTKPESIDCKAIILTNCKLSS